MSLKAFGLEIHASARLLFQLSLHESHPLPKNERLRPGEWQ